MKVVIVGGGILGLATAKTVLEQNPGAEVEVLERGPGVAEGQTGHDSGVVHAGIYYAPGSLKARLCRRGVALMRDFCAAGEIAYDACGKLVVATREDERPRLENLMERATANGVPGLAWLEGAQLRTVEPNVAEVAALHSPETASSTSSPSPRRWRAGSRRAGESFAPTHPSARCGTRAAPRPSFSPPCGRSRPTGSSAASTGSSARTVPPWSRD
jgi:(S)-2-hydroxyglutarate dehydrogenase